MCALVFVVIGLRLVDVQALGGDRYEQLGLSQRVRTVELAAERGSIFDRNGNDLAVSVQQQTVWADPTFIEDPTATAAALAPILGRDEGELTLDLARGGTAFVYLARQVDDAVAEQVAALELPGIGLLPESERFYPSTTLAAPVIGWVGTDNEGLGGLESQYEDLLTGEPGQIVVEQDPQGREIPAGDRQVTPSERGGDLVLTIDQSLQYETERVLVDEVEAVGARGGTAVVIDVQTGQILAMATVEGATAGEPARPAPPLENNRAVTDVYEPGSTNKVITVAGALENDVVSPGTWYEVPSELTVDDTVFEDVTEHEPAMTVADIVRQSSNVGTILIARALGQARFDEALRAFGFGTPTGVGFPGEPPGIVLPLDDYNDTSLASIPVGNGIAVTALQMLQVYATIANGGVMVTPSLVAATVDADGTRHDVPAPTARTVVTPETAAEMQVMLESVVADGTGTLAAVPGYRVAGKTGTARKPPYNEPPYRYVASFAGFAPADDPRLAAIVVLDEPADAYFGGQVAAPVFAQIMQYALRLERVPPTGGSEVPPGNLEPSG